MISDYATNIALVNKETNTVTNIIWGNIYDVDEFNTDTLLAVVINDLDVQIDDTYDGEHFYREGAQVLSMAQQMADMQNALAILLGGGTE